VARCCHSQGPPIIDDMNQLDCPSLTEAVEREEVANMEMEVLVLRLCFSYHHIE
jgi:hypothetical protein